MANQPARTSRPVPSAYQVAATRALIEAIGRALVKKGVLSAGEITAQMEDILRDATLSPPARDEMSKVRKIAAGF